MTAKQVQIRRDVAADLASVTPVEGEMGYDITNKRFFIGDGSRVGGIPHASYRDVQNSTFTNFDVTGTNTLTVTTDFEPAAYTEGMVVIIVPENDNTGAVTIDLGPGAVAIQNPDGSALAGAELEAGVPQQIRYNGTAFRLFGGSTLNINSLTDTTITTSDEIVFADATDSFKNKKDTVQGIVDLAAPSTTFGAVGTYAFMKNGVNSLTGGTTYAGSALFYSDANNGGTSANVPTPTGTWRAMSGDAVNGAATLCVRIS